jgi:hypothetical protein
VRKVLLSCLTAGLLGVTAPVAHAAYPSYRGGCSYATTNNPTGSGALGGRSVWTGVVYLLAFSAGDYPFLLPDGGPITVACELRINGVVQGDVLGPVSGIGVVTGAAPLQFRALETDVVQLCDRVTTAGGSGTFCADATTAQIPPQVIYDAIDTVVDTELPLVGTTRDLLVNPVLALYAELVRLGDAAACATLSALAPAVTALGRPDLLAVDPTGDTHSGSYWLYDCPPAF